MPALSANQRTRMLDVTTHFPQEKEKILKYVQGLDGASAERYDGGFLMCAIGRNAFPAQHYASDKYMAEFGLKVIPTPVCCLRSTRLLARYHCSARG
jgi:hypothetical protein